MNYIDECILQKMGYTVQNIDGYKDGGIDVYAFSNNKKAIAVQCKAWNPQKTTGRISKQARLPHSKGFFQTEGFPVGFSVTSAFFYRSKLWEIAGENLLLVDEKKTGRARLRILSRNRSVGYFIIRRLTDESEESAGS
ncbi:MAG: restriction endonuclease [Enterococcus casseliflavus]